MSFTSTRFDYLIASWAGPSKVLRSLVRFWRNRTDDLHVEVRRIGRGAVDDPDVLHGAGDYVSGVWTSIMCVSGLLFVGFGILAKAVSSGDGYVEWSLLLVSPFMFTTFTSVGIVVACYFRRPLEMRDTHGRVNYSRIDTSSSYLDFWIPFSLSLFCVAVFSWDHFGK
jgi:hypothetical protein